MSWLEEYIEEELERIREENLLRKLRVVSSPQNARVIIDGRELINFSSNNYLGLANHPEIIEAFIEGAKRWGVGSGAARLIVGNHEPHSLLERRLAEFKEKEAALVYTSGYHANVGIISAIMGRGDEIFSDSLNHASIIDGCRLSKAKISVYRHRDMNHLEDLLRKSETKKKLIVTDSVFSMDGDLAPLNEIVELADRYDAAVMIDEAHATGVFGPGGRGLAYHLGLQDKIEIQMGTLGKAVGVFGGYVTGNRKLIDFLINRSRSFIFTTGYPPAMAVATSRALDLIERGDELRNRLWENIRFFRKKAEETFGEKVEIYSPIVPIIIGEPEDTMEISHYLFQQGFFVGAIRPPTVPPGTSRLRVSLMATHKEEEIGRLIDTLHTITSRMGLRMKIGV